MTSRSGVRQWHAARLSSIFTRTSGAPAPTSPPGRAPPLLICRQNCCGSPMGTRTLPLPLALLLLATCRENPTDPIAPNPQSGIVGTPVIDAARGTMYFVARSSTGSTFVQYLHAVSIVDGSELAGSPTAITATNSGNGDGSVNGVIAFDAQRQNQRQGLTLLNGVVYVTFSSHCDWGPYHGWILGYDAATLQQRVVYNATPNGYGGGMWESGTGMAADAAGNLYVVTGDGTVGDAGDPNSLTNRAESALKLTPSGSTLRVASYFTPNDYQFLNDFDLDYGGMGALLVPNSTFYLTGAKDGKLYLLNQDAMGGYSPSADQVQQVVQLRIDANMHCQTAYYKGSTQEFIYVWSENDQLRAIPFEIGRASCR